MKAIEELFCSEVKLAIVIDSKNLFTTLSTCRLDSDRSTLGDVSSIWFEFATKNVSSMIFVPGKIKLAYPGTELDSSLTQALQLFLECTCLPIDFTDAVTVFESIYRLIKVYRKGEEY